MSCQICLNDPRTRDRCSCHKCLTIFCKECVKSWLLSTSLLPQCPITTCSAPWHREVLFGLVTKTWYQAVYLKHRGDILFEKEMTLVPATRPRAKLLSDAMEIQTQVDLKDEQHRTLGKRIASCKQQGQQNLALQLQVDRRMLFRDIQELRRRCKELGAMYKTYSDVVTEDPSVPQKDPICPACSEVVGVAHQCDSDRITTLQLIRSDTKPCPNCNEMITKIDGCSQMWCTRCKTGFDWNTGKIDNGKIHNPHYYEWMRTRGMPAEPCERTFLDIITEDSGFYDYIFECHMQVTHIERVILADAPPVIENTDLRVEYMVGKLDASAFKQQLLFREKVFEKDMELRQVHTTMVDTCNDIFNRIENDPRAALGGYVTELEALRVMSNEAFRDIWRTYNLTVAVYTCSWQSVSIRNKACMFNHEIYMSFYKGTKEMLDELAKSDADVTGMIRDNERWKCGFMFDRHLRDLAYQVVHHVSFGYSVGDDKLLFLEKAMEMLERWNKDMLVRIDLQSLNIR